jgi:hypothetical protein
VDRPDRTAEITRCATDAAVAGKNLPPPNGSKCQLTMRKTFRCIYSIGQYQLSSCTLQFPFEATCTSSPDSNLLSPCHFRPCQQTLRFWRDTDLQNNVVSVALSRASGRD